MEANIQVSNTQTERSTRLFKLGQREFHILAIDQLRSGMIVRPALKSDIEKNEFSSSLTQPFGDCLVLHAADNVTSSMPENSVVLSRFIAKVPDKIETQRTNQQGWPQSVNYLQTASIETLIFNTEQQDAQKVEFLYVGHMNATGEIRLPS